MNKYLIFLGLVLLASLSFAADAGPDNWMQLVQGRYSCAYDYNFHLLELIGQGCEIIDEEEFFEIIDTYFECDEGGDCMYADTYYMYLGGGCERGETNTAMFRSAVAQFNTNAFLFRQIFLSNIRECLANSEECDCDRGDILEGMAMFRSEYMSCLAGEEEPPYCREPEEGGEEDAQ